MATLKKKVEIVRHAGKGSQTLPGRQALQQVASGKKTINDYAKAGRNIAYTGPSLTDPEQL